MKSQLLLLTMIIALVILAGCSEQDNIVSSNLGILQAVWIDPTCVTLYAGQTIDAGTVCVDILNDTLTVVYQTIDGWELTETHLWVDDDYGEMPQTNKGNPKVGLFPYYSSDITGMTEYTFYIPIAEFGGEPNVCDKPHYFAAHAVLRKDLGGGNYQTESAWADGERMVNRGNWATYFTVIFNCGLPPNYITCESSFGYNETYATCFLDLLIDGGFDNWGWTNGALPPGNHTLQIYSGATDCSLGLGVLVGWISIDYDGTTGTATVTYNTYYDALLIETHLFVGSDLLPTFGGYYSIAPKDFPYKHYDLDGAMSDTYTITGLSGNIYVVAHAIVCGAV